MNDFLAKTILWVAREISELLIVYLSFAFFLPSFFLLFSRLFANNDFKQVHKINCTFSKTQSLTM